MRTGSFPDGYIDRSMALTTHSHLAPSLRKEWRQTSTPIWALTACSSVKFTFNV